MVKVGTRAGSLSEKWLTWRALGCGVDRGRGARSVGEPLFLLLANQDHALNYQALAFRRPPSRLSSPALRRLRETSRASALRHGPLFRPFPRPRLLSSSAMNGPFVSSLFLLGPRSHSPKLLTFHLPSAEACLTQVPLEARRGRSRWPDNVPVFCRQATVMRPVLSEASRYLEVDEVGLGRVNGYGEGRVGRTCARLAR